MNIPDLQAIIKKYNNGTASAEEIQLIEQWFESIDHGAAESQTEKQLLSIQKELHASIREHINQALHKNKTEPAIKRLPSPVWWAAAIITLIIPLALYFHYSQSDNTCKLTTKQNKAVETDVNPGGNKAVLTLGNGSKIILDQANAGMLANQGLSKVKKLKDGQLLFETVPGLHTDKSTILTNTLSTPRGGQYQLILPDGSKVWLNAATQLRFPSSFVGKERKVELVGEAYFEVAPNRNMPFRVYVNGMEVEVLGTHFNIMAYAGESSTNTTLLEGSVKVINNKQSKIIVPGQQAQVKEDIQIVEADTEEAVAWKNGITSFKNADIKSIMRQVERWYDVDVTFEGDIPSRAFTGEVSRQVKLSELLKIFELSNINFMIQDRRVIVKP